jgi:hypothetical protein
MKGVEYPVQLNECTGRFASSVNKSSEIYKITSFVFGMCCIRVHSYNYTFIYLTRQCFCSFEFVSFQGLTVQIDESGNLVIARILGGGMIDRQGLLHIGDTILEVNGVPVSTPEDLQIQISKAKESVALKIGPSFDDGHTQLNGSQVR